MDNEENKQILKNNLVNLFAKYPDGGDDFKIDLYFIIKKYFESTDNSGNEQLILQLINAFERNRI